MSFGMNNSMGHGFESRGPGIYKTHKSIGGNKIAQNIQWTPEMFQLFSQLIGNIGPESFLQKLSGGDQSTFDEMEAPALRQFSGLQGNLASRFSGMGLGARKSSGFQNEASGAASNFAQQLQANRQGLQRQALMDIQNMGNQLLGQQPYENMLVPKKQSQWGNIAGNLASAIPGAFSSYLTGGGFNPLSGGM
jgi:hypothetical protein